MKLAVTCWFAVSVNTQGPVPLHAPPDHPVKVSLPSALSVSVTWVPGAKVAMQVIPQFIPAGLLLTVPTPRPAGTTVNTDPRDGLNVAVTCWLELRVKVHMELVPLQGPLLQPAK